MSKKTKSKDKKKFPAGKLLLLGIVIAAGVAIKKALSDEGGTYEPPVPTV